MPKNGRDILPAAYSAAPGVIVKPALRLRLQAAWHLWLAQDFVYVGNEGLVEPRGKTRRWGLELSARYLPRYQLSLAVQNLLGTR